MRPALSRLAAAIAAVAALLASAARADTLVDNVDGFTLDREGRVQRLSGLLIGDDGRIVQVLRRGDRRPARADYLLDGEGRVLMPGLVDGHASIAALGFAALTLDLTSARSLAEVQGRIAAYAAAHPDRPWVLGRGWDLARLGALPDAAALDAAVGDRPAWLVSADGHWGWANSAALAAADITAQSKDPPGGRIDRQAGKPTGIMRETAMTLVEKAVPAPRPEDRDMALAAAQEVLLKRGVTMVTDMGTTIEDWQALRRAGDAGRLSLRIVGYAAGTEAMSLIGGPGPSPWLYDDRLKLNGVFLVLDGARSTGSDWTKAGTATPRLNQAQLRNLMSRAAIDRFQVAIEAHGEAAVGAALDAVGELAQTYKGERRWRIEADGLGGTDATRLGSDTAAVLFPVSGAPRTLVEAKARLAAGSDTPNSAVWPFAAIAGAIVRPDGQNLPREQALAGWTTGAAWAAFADERGGRLAPGLRADFILVDRDPLMAGAGELAETKVLETWVGGRKVWAASSSPAAGALLPGGGGR